MPVSTLQQFTYDDLMTWAQIKSNGTMDAWFAECAKYGVGEEEALLKFLEGTDNGIKIETMADGTYGGYFYNNVEQISNMNPIDSNVTTVSRGNLRQMVGSKFEQVGQTIERNMTRYPVSGGLGQKASYVLGSVGGAYAATSTGIWLGKTIDSTLYNLNPDFWDSAGLSGLNPEIWNSITNGDDSPFAGLFNMILGIDPETGNSQLYMDERALGYMAYALNAKGVFDVGGMQASGIYNNDNTYVAPFNISTNAILYGSNRTRYMWITATNTTPSSLFEGMITNDVAFVSWYLFGSNMSCDPVTRNDVTLYLQEWDYFTDGRILKYSPRAINSNITLGEYTAHTYSGGTQFSGSFGTPYIDNLPSNYNIEKYKIASVYGDISQTSPIEGIGSQPNATLPDTTGWDDFDNVLPSLKQQYPDAFANPLVWDVAQPDGTNSQVNYIPVPMPYSPTGTNPYPTSGDQTQTSTQINPQVIPADMVQQLIDLIQAPQTQPETQTEPILVPTNPVDVGTGTVEPAPLPAGRATALWSVYHPTQGQINDFGAWLWTDNVVERFLQLMNNPMEGIISLHKIFIPPVDAGQKTIVVGRLDSNVPSETVNQQYVYLDCGTVSMLEYFGSVFDYNPYTSISLYLPFIGIVPLNPDDVMRSNINVTYGCDVFTGACLAMVTVTRDGNAVNMYQYAGMCAVQYPLTGAQSSGLISGLLGVAGGIAGIAAASTGVGAVAGITAIAGGAANAGKQQLARSGGFSGNAGALGIKTPYLIIERPQTKVAAAFKELQGYPTNISQYLKDCSGFVIVSDVHIEGINATEQELEMIDMLLHEGVMV